MRPLRPLSLLVLLLFAACGDGTGPKDRVPSGSMSFAYSGSGVSGTFSTSGALRVGASGEPEFGSYGFAAREDSAVALVAFQARQEPRGDYTILVLDPARGTGSYSLDFFSCDTETDGRCAFGMFGLDVDVEKALQEVEATGGEVFIFETGTVVVTRLTQDRVEGTFSGTGLFYDVSTGQQSGPVQVTGGRFELPILTGEQLGNFGQTGSFSRAAATR